MKGWREEAVAVVAVQMRAESSWDECSGGMREDERRLGRGDVG